MRTIWNGSIAFGLVSIPIGLAVAQQRQDISFRTLHRECGTPIKQKRWCPFHERDVEADELVKGWEVAKGQFVFVEESDLEAVALQRSQSIDIVQFVPLADVDPVYFDRAYYLAPAEAEAQRRPYVLLLRAMQQADVAAVGRFVLWGKENLCLIRPLDDTLALELLYYAEDIRSRDEILDLVAQTEVRDAELAMARQLVDSLVGAFEPEAYANDYRRQLRGMLEAKVDGQEISRPEPAEPAPVIDLMEALRQSVAQAQKEKAPAKRPTARRPRAKT
jgi:DNA end-binding protein Ku